MVLPKASVVVSEGTANPFNVSSPLKPRKFVWLNTLKKSARNSTLTRSRMEIVLATDKSKRKYGSPLPEFLATFPFKNWKCTGVVPSRLSTGPLADAPAGATKVAGEGQNV